jgi:hypothetical protein
LDTNNFLGFLISTSSPTIFKSDTIASGAASRHLAIADSLPCLPSIYIIIRKDSD